MVRWKYCLVLALLLLTRIDAKDDDDDDDCNRGEDNDEDEDDEDDDDEEERSDAMEIPGVGRRAVKATSAIPEVNQHVTPSRTTKKAPLECYVCGYRSEMPLRSCLDPTKYRVHSVTCHNPEDKCFTTVVSKDKTYVAVIRGCRTGCISSPDTTCCERNRCNNQAFAMPIVLRTQDDNPRPMADNAAKTTPSNVLFFVTVLLLLQTVVKVAFV